MINIHTNKQSCCGCYACAQKCPQQCITMHPDNEGFDYPIVDKEKCIECGLCEKVCPVFNPLENKLPLLVMAAAHKDESIRKASSSGGIFTLLSMQTLHLKGIVFGAKFDKNWQVVMDYTEKEEGLTAFRGSKYVQCSTRNTFKQAEIFLFLRKEYDNLLTVNFICHGVPSPKVWKLYLKAMPPISDITFRDKSMGWKKFQLVFSFAKGSGKIATTTSSSMFNENAYMQAFLSDMILRPSCYACPVRKGKSQSDITIGDHWAVPYICPDFDDDKGTSLVLVNTEKGHKYLDEKQLRFIETDFKASQMYNGGFLDIIHPHPHRNRFFGKLDATKNISMLIRKELKVPLYERILQKTLKMIERINRR